MRYPLLAVETLSFQPAIAKHLGYLRILLSVLSEYQFSLIVVVLVLSSSAVFPSLPRMVAMVG
jgi:hypothetical protein